MNSKTLARSLKLRTNIYHTRNIVSKYVKKPPRDWDGLEITIENECRTNTDLLNDLKEYLIEEIENNDKVVSLFRPEPDQAEIFKSLILTLEKEKSYTYPDVLTGSQLSSLSNTHVIAFVGLTGTKHKVVLTRKRTFTLRKVLDKNSMSSDVQKELIGYDEVFGVADYNWQTFDVIIYDQKTGILEVRADCTRSETSQQNSKQIGRSLGEASGWAGFASATYFKKTFIHGGPLNLFGAIAHFTFEKDGLISKLHFMTPQGSVKQDTMKKGEDLRSEVFHAKGMEAVGDNIVPYDISVIWHHTNRFGAGQQVELTIPSTLAVALLQSTATQTYAIIRYCSTTEDADLLIDKLLGALK